MHHPHDDDQDDSQDHGDHAEAILIPWQRLSQDALIGVIEEFITREGTDYGQTEYSLADKRSEVMSQVRDGRVVIEYAPSSGTCTLRKNR